MKRYRVFSGFAEEVENAFDKYESMPMGQISKLIADSEEEEDMNPSRKRGPSADSNQNQLITKPCYEKSWPSIKGGKSVIVHESIFICKSMPSDKDHNVRIPCNTPASARAKCEDFHY